MLQSYLEYQFKVSPLVPGREILVAELGYVGFESFVETEDGITAYIQKKDFSEKMLKEIQILSSEEFEIDFTSTEIKQVNWNAEWEKNFESIEVDGKCIVRAPFHAKTDHEYEIVIEPKMSFGTGHHETTFMMLQYILEAEFIGKKILDMGCGTAVLAILAEMRGATEIDAIDIDPWCFENSEENTKRNSSKNITVYQGDASLLLDIQYDVIIANINRNILINDMAIYRKCLKKGGELYLSGFYKEDLSLIIETCNKLGLTFVDNKERHNWIAAKFVI